MAARQAYHCWTTGWPRYLGRFFSRRCRGGRLDGPRPLHYNRLRRRHAGPTARLLDSRRNRTSLRLRRCSCRLGYLLGRRHLGRGCVLRGRGVRWRFRRRLDGCCLCRHLSTHSGRSGHTVGMLRLRRRLGWRRWLRFKIGLGGSRCGFKDNRNLGLWSRLLIKKRGDKIVAAPLFNFKYEWLAGGRQSRVRRNRIGLGVAAAHDRFVKSLLDDLAGSGFQHHFMAQDRGAISLLAEVGFDTIGFLAGQEARIQPPVGQFEAFTAMDHVRDRDVPFLRQCFYAFTSHSLYSIQAPRLELAVLLAGLPN